MPGLFYLLELAFVLIEKKSTIMLVYNQFYQMNAF